WQTEICIMGNDTEIGGGQGYDFTMKTALYVARVIHHDLTYADAESWSWWRACGGNYRDGLIRVYEREQRARDSKLLWALGNYSRFIRPGYKRVAVTGADNQNGLMASSWLSPDEKTLVTVFVNMDQNSQKTSITVADNAIESVKTYLTDKNYSLKYQSKLNDASSLEIPARSVVTVVATLSGSTGIHAVTVPQRHDVAHKHATNNIYALDGLAMPQPHKGVYIQNGRKNIFR
ncbi:MAG: hypothetical protein J6Q22_18490, partial [Prevotella sp.]|nr:hypothetical protein [Prevotella sp.]